jgi:hypothetical protein
MGKKTNHRTNNQPVSRSESSQTGDRGMGAGAADRADGSLNFGEGRSARRRHDETVYKKVRNPVAPEGEESVGVEITAIVE